MSNSAPENENTVLLEGYTADEILSLPDALLDAIALSGEPTVFRFGTAEVLGSFQIDGTQLIVELAQIEGGGEGVLPALWVLTERYARQRGLSAVEWIVHAVNCAKPNPKLRRVLVRRGFQVQDVPWRGQAYYLLHPLP
jgi:hypothetical protein